MPNLTINYLKNKEELASLTCIFSFKSIPNNKKDKISGHFLSSRPFNLAQQSGPLFLFRSTQPNFTHPFRRSQARGGSVAALHRDNVACNRDTRMSRLRAPCPPQHAVKGLDD
jgi:hypothetical protein